MSAMLLTSPLLAVKMIAKTEKKNFLFFFLAKNFEKDYYKSFRSATQLFFTLFSTG